MIKQQESAGLFFTLLTRQIDSVVHFESRQVLDNWDKQIQSLCFQVIWTFLDNWSNEQVYFLPVKWFLLNKVYLR